MSIAVYKYTYIAERWIPSTAKLFKMPGGEWHVQGLAPEGAEYAAIVYGASADDLTALRILSDAVRRDGGTLSAAVPYLPGARQDRRQPGEALSAKVYADLINACELETVLVLDPHSDVIVSHLDNVVLMDLPEVIEGTIGVSLFAYAGLIIPDAGAGKRVATVAAAAGLPTYQALKHRDMSTGKLSGFTCEPLPDDEGRFLVVDDICDGGGTFKGLADALGVGRDRLDLWVSHGIFSSGAETLSVYYSNIFTTNSFPGSDIPGSKRSDLTSLILNTL